MIRRRPAVETLFDRAIQLSDAERPRFVEESCADDPELRQELEALLSFDREERPFLETPVVSPEALVSGGDAPAPRNIGPYRVEQLLGEGGMGSVYLAQQEEPIRRTVAIKLIRRGLDSRRILARFRTEQRTLAAMDHPGIAKVFEAGRTDDGRPFFAMEYVDGTPITTFCDQHGLSIRHRLRLFAQACSALHHAHQKGVIHRDIKPSNILVIESGGVPTPKLIDFGIAKATAVLGAGSTRLTLDGQVVGTPEYMSPEQARSGHENLDTRSDIYSLGVLLYELLVGALPFTTPTPQLGLGDLVRSICELVPPKPSTRLVENAPELETAARLRGGHPRTLISELRGDLDCIVMTALEKDRELRYDSAAALAADVERYLDSSPILAMPPSRWYRLSKFVRRNRLSVFGAVAFLTLLVVALFTTGVLYRRADARYTEIVRLSDLQRLDQYQREAEELAPPTPELLPELEAWLDRAHALVARLPLHRESLAKLRSAAMPASDAELASQRESFPGRGELERMRSLLDETRADLAGTGLTAAFRQLYEEQVEQLTGDIAHLELEQRSYREYAFDRAEDTWHHQVLAKLVHELEAFGDPDAAQPNTLADMERRTRFAREARDAERADPSPDWRAAIDAIRRSPLYAGLELAPQRGLVPLGADPRSNYWEFAHVLSGTVPHRSGDGRLVIDESSAVVLILLPGGTFDLGAQPIPLHVSTVSSESTVVVRVHEQCGIELRPGDRIAEIEGVAVATVPEIYRALARCRPGQTVTIAVERAGEMMTRTATAPHQLDPHASNWEGPVHRIELAPFFMSKYEVTQAQWLRLTAESPSFFGPDSVHGDRRHSRLHPVESVSHTDCRIALRRWGLVLPTEARWEYAARGGQTTPWFTGITPESIQGYGNLADQYARRHHGRGDWSFEPEIDDGYLATAPVGSYAANPFGLHDTIGNVHEWCLDRLGDYHRAQHRPGDGLAVGASIDQHVIRGGAYDGPATTCRSAARAVYDADRRSTTCGVRPVRPLDDEE